MRYEKSNKTAMALMLAMGLAASLPQSAGAETVLRIGMTAADIPRTLGQPDQGYEGNGFTGLTMYDSLTMWDLSSADKASGVIPGLSTEWKVNDDDHTKWLFKLRPGVKFHDGSPFNADAVVWNVEKVLKQDAPQFDPSQVGVTATRMPTLVAARKIDDLTVEMTTEAPAPDALPEMKQRGFVLYSNEEPHVWPWQFSRVEGSPWNDIRVRKAANLCVDREGLKDGLLAGLMVPATGTYEAGHPWHGNPTFLIKYDKPAAQKLMQDAGYGPNKHLAVKIQTSASGSGQMQPVSMNEYLQQALAECYFDVQLDVIEWNTLFTNWRRGAKDPTANGANATNVTYAAMDPFFALVRFLQSSMAPPVSNNWGYINNPKFDELVTKARQTFEPAARDAPLPELHAAAVDDAAFLYVAHDVAPRAMSPKVKGFVQPKSWFVDFSPISMTP